MPIYEYQCKECQTLFEVLVQSSKKDAISCPSCDSANVKKQCSTFVSGTASGGSFPQMPPSGGCEPAGTGFS